MFICISCGQESKVTLAACPEGIEGCLAAHYDSQSYVCTHCGHDNSEWCLKALQGPQHEHIGVAIGNVASIAKLELWGRGEE